MGPFMGDDKKKEVAVILGGTKPKYDHMKSENEKAGEKSPYSEGLMSAADEIMSAISKKDASGLIEALKSFNDLCETEGDEPSMDMEVSE